MPKIKSIRNSYVYYFYDYNHHPHGLAFEVGLTETNTADGVKG